MKLVADILLLHEKSINDFGGAHGVRDAGLLEAALARPFQTFGGNDLYPTIIEKAAALGENLKRQVRVSIFNRIIIEHTDFILAFHA